GDDAFLYNINAPVNIDGGAGVDRVVVLGTEYGDTFLITDQGIFGAGLSISFAGVEVAEVDGLEGDDTFYVMSTSDKVVTNVIGGLGNDRVVVGGDVTGEIVSSGSGDTGQGTVTHSVTSADAAYDGAYADTIRVGVATATSSLLEVDQSGLTQLIEGGLGGFYRVRLTQAITAPAWLTVSAARSSTQDREAETLGSDPAASVLVQSGAQMAASAITLGFDASNWNQWQTVYVSAPQDDAVEGTRTVVISHMITGGGQVTASTKLQDVDATVVDDDMAYVVVEGGITSLSVTEGAAGLGIGLSLSQAPKAGETITVTPSFGGSDIMFTASPVTFDASNWNVVQTVTLSAVDDSAYENREEWTVKFDVTSTDGASAFLTAPQAEIDVTVNDNDRGAVIIAQSGGSTVVRDGQDDSYTMVLSRAPTAAVQVAVQTDGQTLASSSDARFDAATGTVTFDATNWDQPITITLTMGTPGSTTQPTISLGTQPQLLSAIAGPLFVWGGTGTGADRSLSAGLTLPSETDSALPNVSAATDEAKQTDVLEIYNAGSVTDDSGLLTENNLSGLGMGTASLTLNVGSSTSPVYQTFAAGISYDQFELVEVMLGQGDDSLDIASTQTGAITVVHGGGGGDTITTVTSGGSSDAATGGADRTLIVFGDTAQD
ncbi:MAG: hypothetical protein EBU97_03730, partial [Rhodobacteraceae bacterium]|nr:hypothetical protein [Paracoccaceae bacterium]